MTALDSSPQDSGICEEEEAETSEEPEVTDDFKDIVFSRHNRADAHENLQRL